MILDAPLLTLDHTARLLAVSRVTLRRIVRAGELPIAQTTIRGKQKRYFFNYHDVLALKERRTYPPTLDTL